MKTLYLLLQLLDPGISLRYCDLLLSYILILLFDPLHRVSQIALEPLHLHLKDLNL